MRTLFLVCGEPPSCCILTWQRERFFLLGHQSYGIRDFSYDLIEPESPLTGSISNTVTLEGGLQQGDLGTGFNPLKSLCFSPL